MLFENVSRIAVSDQIQRREAIKSILQERQIPFKIQRSRQGRHDVENIIITFGDTDKYIVFGAHYDSVEGSTGANDNASGVSILIELAACLRTSNATGIEIVFFDREETDDHGSIAYIDYRGKEKIACMMNLDMCGFGDLMWMVSKFNINNPIFGSLLRQEVIDRHDIFYINKVPFRIGDDESFDEAGIPNVTIETIAFEERSLAEAIGKAIEEGNGIPNELRQRMRTTISATTYHNAINDNISFVNEKCMTNVLDYLLDGLNLPIACKRSGKAAHTL